MSGESKNLATEIATHPKTTVFFSWLVSVLTNGAAWYVEWASPIVAALISISSVILIVTGIRLNITNNKKTKLDIQKIESENQTLRDELKGISDRKQEK